MENNELKSIELEGAFGYLPFLESLSLKNNRIRNLGSKIFEGSDKLEILDISFNELTSIRGNSFFGLNKLKIL